MFSKNLKEYYKKIEETQKELTAIEYICSAELYEYIAKVVYPLKPKIKQSDIFTIQRVNRYDADIIVKYSSHIFYRMPAVLLDTCPQVSFHESKVGDKFIHDNKTWTITAVDDYDGSITAEDNIAPHRFDAYELDGVLWVG